MGWEGVEQVQGFEVEEDIQGRVLVLRSTSFRFPNGEPFRAYIVKGEMLSEKEAGFYTITDFADIFCSTGALFDGNSVMVKFRVRPNKKEIEEAIGRLTSMAQEAVNSMTVTKTSR